MQTAIRLPTPQVTAQAREAVKALRPIASRAKARTLRVVPDGGKDDITITIPREAFDLFLELLGQMANGNAVTIVPVHAEMTTQQAADLLNVSRPYLVELLESGAIPFRMVGTHRRVQAADVISYKEKDDAERRRVLDELAADAEDNDLGY